MILTMYLILFIIVLVLKRVDSIYNSSNKILDAIQFVKENILTKQEFSDFLDAKFAELQSAQEAEHVQVMAAFDALKEQLQDALNDEIDESIVNELTSLVDAAKEQTAKIFE